MLTTETAPTSAYVSAKVPQYPENNCQDCYTDYTSPALLALMTEDAGARPKLTLSGYTFDRCPICGGAGRFTVSGGRWCCECGTPVHGDTFDYMVLMHHACSRRDALGCMRAVSA